MVRKRTQLLNLFPTGAVSPAEASEALRAAQGDVALAREYLENEHQQRQQRLGMASRPDGTTSKASTIEVTPKEEEDTIVSKKPDQKSKAAVKEDVKPVAKESTGKAEAQKQAPEPRRPPQQVSAVNNLSDRQYCCVWWVEVYEDGYRPDIARSLLARVARHVNPILRDRGWRVKRLLESASSHFLGCCTPNDKRDADGASVNIQLNLRRQPNKHCTRFRSFGQILNVMLHEITHIAERHHRPPFWQLLQELKQEYSERLRAGEVAKETDDYGCHAVYITPEGVVSTIEESAKLPPDYATASTLEEGDCGSRFRGRRNFGGSRKKRSAARAMGTQAALKSQKRRPLLKGTKMVDKRTREGRALMDVQQSVPARELAARAALARVSTCIPVDSTDGASSGLDGVEAKPKLSKTEESDNSEEEEEEEDFAPQEHPSTCNCRACRWDKLICGEIASTIRDWN